MKKILLLLIAIQFIACTSDDAIPTKFEISNLKLEVSNIEITTVKTKISYTELDVSEGTLVKKVLYKKESESTWAETQEIEIAELERGTTYIAKAVLQLKDLEKESAEVKFITKGFNGSELIGRMGIFNRIYVLHNFDDNADFSQAAAFSGFVKVDNDSLEIKNIKIKSDKSIDFELPENTQLFFENDEEYKTEKEFSLSLYSGDYRVELTSDLYLIYNKNPHFTKVNAIIQGLCSDPFSLKRRLQLVGFFWTTKDGDYDIKSDTYNNPKEFTITIKSKTDANFTKVLTFNDMVSVVNDCSPFSFDWNRLGRDQGTLFHQNNVIHIQIDDETFKEGVYTVQLNVTNFEGKNYDSNILEFKLENY